MKIIGNILRDHKLYNLSKCKLTFQCYQITHISDIHSGSLNNIKSVEYAVELINEQNSDLILFTGDIVNNRADELDVWKNTLSKIEAKQIYSTPILKSG